MKRTKLRAVGKSDSAKLKRDIQALLRQIVIKRDGGCVLRGYGSCSQVLQAEHMITRGNAATYGDSRNIVCLCSYHHGIFKKQHSLLYWQYIEKIIGPARWGWLQTALHDRFKPQRQDWVLVKLALTQELARTPAWVDPRAR